MNTVKWHVIAAVAVVSLAQSIPGAVAASSFPYDLERDWSDEANPNGVWSYNAGDVPLPLITNWEGSLSHGHNDQTAWANSADGDDRVPAWFKSNGREDESGVGSESHRAPIDWIGGDVVVHTTDPFSGQGNGPANVTWTSPVSATVGVQLQTWLGRDIGRAADWTLSLNELLLGSGSLFSGDPWSRSNPLSLNIEDLMVAQGDILKLQFDTQSSNGEFVGVRLTVVPVPAALPLFASALAGLGLIGWRQRKARRLNSPVASEFG